MPTRMALGGRARQLCSSRGPPSVLCMQALRTSARLSYPRLQYHITTTPAWATSSVKVDVLGGLVLCSSCRVVQGHSVACGVIPWNAMPLQCTVGPPIK